jgi:molecular chaperone HtpG
MPEWLSFLKGIIDSEDLPLNISREMLQQSRVVRVIKKNVIKRSIELFQELSEDEDKYKIFYEQFSKNIKIGLHEDSSNKDKLAKLLRFHSSNTEDMISIDNYIDNMDEKQSDIYYMTGESLNYVKHSSYVKGLVSKGYNVLFMTEPIDEYVLQKLTEYDGKKLVSITKSDFKLPETDDEKKTFDELQLDYKDTCEKILSILKDTCENVVLSNRLIDSPCCIVTDNYGWSANMERIMKAQTMGDTNSLQYMRSKKILEINPNHIVIKGLKKNFELDNETNKLINNNIVNLMFETSLIDSGFTLENHNNFVNRIYSMLEMGLDVDKEEQHNDNVSILKEPDVEELEEMENVD